MSDRIGQPDTARVQPSRSLADLVGDTEGPRLLSISSTTWIKILILAGLFAAVNYWQFRYLVLKWLDDANWSHGFLIPLFSLYLLYARRAELLGARRRVSLWGLPIMILGILFTIAGFFVTPYVSQLSMLIVVFGLVLYLAGGGVMRVAWVPIAYLVLAVPIPAMIYERIAVPLQGLAAKSSGLILRIFGAEVQVTALNLRITSLSGEVHPLLVAEACSGVRSLMAFVALSVAIAYIEDRPLWQRIVLILAGIPIAVVCNIIRVTLTSTMYVVDKPEFGQDIMHKFMGMVLLIPALLLLLLLNKLLHSMYVEEEEGEAARTEPVAEKRDIP